MKLLIRLFTARHKLLFCLWTLFLFSCHQKKQDVYAFEQAQLPVVHATHLKFSNKQHTEDYTQLEQQLLKQGFLDVQKIDKNLVIDLGYTKADNFTGEILYDSLRHAFLQPLAYQKLEIALSELQKLYPNYTFRIFDALRPRSVQHKMWDVVENTEMELYVANPFSGSIHNYGLAVDLSIYDLENNKELDMGTEIDHLGWKSQYRYNSELVREKLISQKAMDNRVLLRKVMKKAGFHPIESEWWHFNALPGSETKRRFQIVE